MTLAVTVTQPLAVLGLVIKRQRLKFVKFERQNLGMRSQFVGPCILNNSKLCVHLYKTKIHGYIQTSNLVIALSLNLEGIK